MNKSDFKIGHLYGVKNKGLLCSRKTLFEPGYSFFVEVPIGYTFCLLGVESRLTGLFPESMGYIQLKFLFEDEIVYGIYIQSTDFTCDNPADLLEEVPCHLILD